MTDTQRKIKEIDKAIEELRRKRRELEEIEKAEYLETAKANVGRCFYNSKKKEYCKIIDVPQDEWTYDCKCIFTEEYYPVVIVYDEEIVPVQEDTLYLRNNLIEGFETEITKEEFEKVLRKRFSGFFEDILKI